MTNLVISTSDEQDKLQEAFWTQGQRDDYRRREELRRAWVDDLAFRYPWDEFATCTFKLPQFDTTRALAMFRHWLNGRYFAHAVKIGEAERHEKPKLGSDGRQIRIKSMEWDRQEKRYHPVFKPEVFTWHTGSFQNRWKRKSVRPVYIAAVEKHVKGDNHIHALIHHRVYAEEIRRDAGWDRWKNKLGYGRMRLEPPRSDEDVRGYVGKYITKDGAELEISDTFKASQLPQENKGPEPFQGAAGPAVEDIRSPAAVQ